jgi:hypothetical protein
LRKIWGKLKTREKVCEKKIGTNRRLKAGYREGALGRE